MYFLIVSADIVVAAALSINLFFLYITIKSLLIILRKGLVDETRACGPRYSPFEYILLLLTELPLVLLLDMAGGSLTGGMNPNISSK